MASQLPPALAAVIARAYIGGTETSIARLSELLGLSDSRRLTAALDVVHFVESLQLELVPSPEEAEFESVRVLRLAASASDTMGRVRDILELGESTATEFKSSMLCSMLDWQQNAQLVEFPSLSGELLKTVCAFLNTEGGDLLVGVDNAGNPCEGLKLDLQLKTWDLDQWQLHFHSLVAGRFYDGQQIQPYLRTQLIELDDAPIFHVRVMPRAARSFVQREKGKAYEFFVRNGPRTDSLDLPGFYGHLAALRDV